MAVEIESTSIQASYVTGDDLGSTTGHDVTAPTGIQEGDLLVIAFFTTAGTGISSTGWTQKSLTQESVFNGSGSVLYKYATVADETATDWTVVIDGGDNIDAMWTCYRITGGVSSGDPFIDADGELYSYSSAIASTISDGDVSLGVTDGALILMMFGGNWSTDTSGISWSNQNLQGITATLTERIDDYDSGDRWGMLADTVVTNGGIITGWGADCAVGVGSARNIYVNVLAILEQQDSSSSTDLLEETPEIFIPELSNGAQSNVALLEGTPIIQAPTAITADPKVTNVAKNDATNITNVSKS